MAMYYFQVNELERMGLDFQNEAAALREGEKLARDLIENDTKDRTWLVRVYNRRDQIVAVFPTADK